MEKLIVTAHHKNDIAIPVFKDFFSPIHVGAALSNIELGIGRDDLGNNISHKNKNYCELTALYYVLNNLDFEYAGLMHYRRVFTLKKFSLSDLKNNFIYLYRIIRGVLSISDLNLFKDNNIQVSTLSELRVICDQLSAFVKSDEFESIDIILPKKVRYAYLNIAQQYAINHCLHQFELFNKIIFDKYPELSEAVEVVNKQKELYPYNMYVMKRKYFVEYNNMLFNVLNEMENHVDLNSMDAYQARIFGFLSERFLNYYIFFVRSRSDIKVKELRTVFLKENLS